LTFKKLPNGKWRYVKEVPRGKIDPYDPDYDKRVKAKFRKTKVFCDTCKTTYTLAAPCIHHLSDSPEHREREKELKRKQQKIKNDESSSQQRFI
jgi:hypothetical protein